MSYEYSEDALIEQATQDVLEELGWKVVTAWKKETFGPDGLLGRETKMEVILRRYLLAALEKLNPNVPSSAYQQATEAIEQRIAGKTLGRINKEKYQLLRNGVPVSFTNQEGQLVKRNSKSLILMIMRTITFWQSDNWKSQAIPTTAVLM